MFNLESLKTFSFRRALSTGCAVLGALIVNHYYSFSNEFWMVLSAFLVCTTTRGTPLKQSQIIFTLSALALIVSTVLSETIKNGDIIYLFISIIFIFSAYLSFINRPQANKTFFLMNLFSIVLLIAALSSIKSVDIMQNRIFDLALGGIIGICSTLLILPMRLDTEFSAGVIPILSSLNEFSHALIKNIIDSETDKTYISKVREKVETALQTHHGMYPEWVYEAGFNRGLRSGFRFFLVNVERVTENFFSMDYLLSRGIDTLILRELDGVIENTMKKNQELIAILLEYFKTKKIGSTESDFTSDIAELERALHSIVPDNLEALEISTKFLMITAFVRELRDLRGLLLQLVMALPAAKNQL